MNRWLCTPQGPRGLVKPVRHAIAVAIALSATLLPSACASPVEGLRPPSPDSPARTIFVSLDTWHAMIAFSESEQPAASNKQEEHMAENIGLVERIPMPDDNRRAAAGWARFSG